jgi:hypothetical protein
MTPFHMPVRVKRRLTPPKARALADRLVGDAELIRDGERGSGVEHIVLAGHRQAQPLDHAGLAAGPVLDLDVEDAPAVSRS